LAERLLIASLFLAAGDLAGKVLAFVITVIRTRSLTPAEFGGFGFILQTVGMFAQVAGFSLGLAATRYVALYRQSQPAKAREVAQFVTVFGLLTTGIAAVLMVVLAPQLVRNVPGLVEPLRWGASILVFQTLSGLFLGLLAGLERFRAATAAVFLQNVVMLTLTAWWAPGWGLTGTILATAAGFAITLLVALVQARDLIGGRWASFMAIWAHRRILFEFCLPMLLGGAAIVYATWQATEMIASRNGPVAPLLAGLLILPPAWVTSLGLAYRYATGLREVAYFTAADQFRPMLAMLANVVAQPMMPMVTQAVHQVTNPKVAAEEREEARRRSRRLIERCFQLLICLILPAHAFLAFAAPYIMAIFGRTFAVNWGVFLIVLAWGAINGITSLLGVALNALGRVWTVNALLALYGAALVGFTVLWRDHGAEGLGWAHLGATAVALLSTCAVLVRLRLLSTNAIVLQLSAIAWIALMTIVSAFCAELSAVWRIVGIFLALLATCLALLVTLRAELVLVSRLLVGKVRGRLRSRAA